MAVLVLVLGGALVAAWPAVAGWLEGPSPTPDAVLLATTADDVARARARLGALPVVARPAPDPAYSRAAFGDAWTDTDRNGCNQRDDVLLRDLVATEPYRLGRQRRCDHDVLAGTWRDPYTGTLITLTDAKAQGRLVQIDHLVALSVAWRYGARDWTDARRLQFANDLRNLVAVGADANDAKGGSDAAEWQPVPPARCGYAVRYVLTKAAYGLPVDPVEKNALARMLDTCG